MIGGIGALAALLPRACVAAVVQRRSAGAGARGDLSPDCRAVLWPVRPVLHHRFCGPGAGKAVRPFLCATARMAVAAGLGWLAVVEFEAGPTALSVIVAISLVALGGDRPGGDAVPLGLGRQSTGDNGGQVGQRPEAVIGGKAQFIQLRPQHLEQRQRAIRFTSASSLASAVGVTRSIQATLSPNDFAPATSNGLTRRTAPRTEQRQASLRSGCRSRGSA